MQKNRLNSPLTRVIKSDHFIIIECATASGSSDHMVWGFFCILMRFSSELLREFPHWLRSLVCLSDFFLVRFKPFMICYDN